MKLAKRVLTILSVIIIPGGALILMATLLYGFYKDLNNDND